jgi:RNA polymerase sigma factor (sigma-70 family)
MTSLSGTRWTVIVAAQTGDSEAIEALSVKYRAPVVAYLTRRGAGEDAEDLAQEVFVSLFHEGALAGANSRLGRFRSLVYAVTRNVLGHFLERASAHKRGAGRVEPLSADVAAPTPDDDFDTEWLGHLLEAALERLEREHAIYYEALHAYLVEEQTVAEVGERLGLSATNVRNRVHRGRRKLIAYLRDEVLYYSTSAEDYGVELRAMARLMGEGEEGGDSLSGGASAQAKAEGD